VFRPTTLSELGGLDENEDPTAVAKTSLTLADNTARHGKLTGTRPGFGHQVSEYQAQISGSPPVQGIVEWTTDRDSDRNVVVVAGGNVYTDDTVQLDKATNSVSITTGQDNPWTFADHNNKLYAAGGATTDHIWYWDGTNPLQKILIQNSASQNLQPLYVFHWKNYLFLSGLRGRTLPDDNPMVWRYHDLATDPTVAANWPNGNTIGGTGIGGLGGYGSEYSTGTASFQDNQGSYLLLLTNKRIYSFVQSENSLVGFSKNDEIANGCVNQNAYVDLGLDSGDAIYMSEVGIHSLRLSQQYSGRARAFLSWPIRNTFATLNRNRFKYVTAGYWPTEGIVAFAVSTGSVVNQNLILAIDIQNATEITPDSVRWYKWTLSPDLVGASEHINYITFGRDTANRPGMFVGTSAGRVGVMNRDDYTDFGNNYSTTFQTKHEDFGAPMTEKTVGDLKLVLRGSGDYLPTHQYLFDYGSRMQSGRDDIELPAVSGIWGTMTWGVDSWGTDQALSSREIYGNGSGDTISHKFSHSPAGGRSEPFFVAEISQEVSATGESATTTEDA